MKEINLGKKRVSVKQQALLSKPRKETFVSKMVGVVIDDIKNLVLRKEVLIGETPEGWEDYQRFCELARKK